MDLKHSMLLNVMLIIYLYENIEMFMQDSNPQSIVWRLNEVDIQILLKNRVFVHIVKLLLGMNNIFFRPFVQRYTKKYRYKLLYLSMS